MMPIFRKEKKAAGTPAHYDESSSISAVNTHEEYIYPDPRPDLGIQRPKHWPSSSSSLNNSAAAAAQQGPASANAPPSRAAATGGRKDYGETPRTGAGYASPAISSISTQGSSSRPAYSNGGTFSSASAASSGSHGSVGGGALGIHTSGLAASSGGSRSASAIAASRKSKLERLTGEDVPGVPSPGVGIDGTKSPPPGARSRSRLDSSGSSGAPVGPGPSSAGLVGAEWGQVPSAANNAPVTSTDFQHSSRRAANVLHQQLSNAALSMPHGPGSANSSSHGHYTPGGAGSGGSGGGHGYSSSLSSPSNSYNALHSQGRNGTSSGSGSGINTLANSSSASRMSATSKLEHRHSTYTDSSSTTATTSTTAAGGGPGTGGSNVSRAMHRNPHASMLDTSSDEPECPVCLEPLSHRLTGEKPHVVPQCGHALHNACFTAVYGSPQQVLAMQKRNALIQSAQRGAGAGGAGSGPDANSERYQASQAPGMCGVCRRAIVLGPVDAKQNSKALKATGIIGTMHDSPPVTHGSKDADDPLDLATRGYMHGNGSYASMGPGMGQRGGMVVPILRARPEYSTVYRRDPTSRVTKQNVVCVVSVDVPARRPSEPMDEHMYAQVFGAAAHPHLRTIPASEYGEEEEHELGSERGSENQVPQRQGARTPGPEQDGGSPPPSSLVQGGSSDDAATGFSFGATPTAEEARNDPYRAVSDDLRARIVDWKGHTIDHFGPLHLYDTLNVRQGTVVREFYVYLFQEALLCVTEERKRGISKLVAATAAATGHDEGVKAGLKLKGRIYLRHIKLVRESSVAGEPSLSIKMDDEHLDEFVLCFKTETQAKSWRGKLEELVEYIKNPNQSMLKAPKPGLNLIDKSSAENGEEDNAARALISRRTSQISGKAGSLGDAASVAESSATKRSQSRRAASRAGSNIVVTGPKVPIIPLHQQWSSSGGRDPSKPPPEMLPHAPLDLIIMVSIPVVVDSAKDVTASISSSAALKLRLIRASLEFIVNNLGPADRISLISYTVGADGQVRKTPLLQPSKDLSRYKLLRFIEGMGTPHEGPDTDPFLEDLSKLGGGSDRIDTVTALNVGLDVVLQRTIKNPTTGMILVNDTAAGPKRNQMDLVMARAEAANVPIHCFGYGKNHDPSSLWLISNHTRGSYTFIREWFQLRECLTGCIGSLMSVALTDVKVHISLPADNKFRVRKVSGVVGSIVSANGKDVDIELGYVTFGDSREFFVELEVDFEELLAYVSPPNRKPGVGSPPRKKLGPAQRPEGSTATDDFMARLGIQSLSLDGEVSNGDIDSMGQFIEEVPVLEVDAGFKDPIAQQSVTRMLNPTILTLEVDPNTPDPTVANESSSAVVATLADPVVTRRRLEILVSDMITRALLLVSRNNHAQAQRLLAEIRRIIETVLASIPVPSRYDSSASAMVARGTEDRLSSRVGGPRRQRELLHAQTFESLGAILDDLDTLLDGLEHNKASFERDTKNFGAQQAMVLRDQKAWTTRTNSEYLRCRDDNSFAFAALAYVHSLPR